MQTTTLNDQTLKDQIVTELDRLPVEMLTEVLAYVQSLNLEAVSTASTATAETVNTAIPATAPMAEPAVAFADQEAVWQAYLDTETEREEVYRRLAGS